jgi:homoserine O-succinyltransferase
MRGFSDEFAMPVSRWTAVRREDIPADSGLTVLAECDATGLGLMDDPWHRSLHMLNHIEYDTQSLMDEYVRDLGDTSTISVPANYFPQDDPLRQPANCWRGHAHLLLANWINAIYQTTPFDTSLIGFSP